MSAIHKRFGATQALDGVSLQVAPGEVLALVGENGAGKSTLMKVLSGAYRPDNGQMWLDGDPYRPRRPIDAREAGVAMIYQELSLAPHLSVMENVLLGVESVRGPLVDWPAMRQRTVVALREIGLVDVSPDTEVRRLAPAQQQLVEIARAVALECRVLIFDEPTSSLAHDDIPRLFSLVRRLARSGIAVIYISHFLEEVQEISDRYVVLRDGRTVGGGPTAGTPADQIVALMVGRQVDELYPRSDRPTDGEAELVLDEVAGGELPRSASLSLRRGQVLGIAGLNGAGRTELIRCLFGLDRVTSGSIRIGVYAGPATPRRRWSQGVGMVSEDRKNEGLAMGLSIADNITLASLEQLGPGRLVLPARQRRAARPWIDRIPIKCTDPGQAVADLSGGNQQKVALARLLHAGVDVLLLDEPTRGIDVGSKAEVYRLIDSLAVGDASARRAPKAVLLISSYLPELLGVCDEIAVMTRGRLSPARPVDQWDEHRLMLAATGQQQPDASGTSMESNSPDGPQLRGKTQEPGAR